MSDSVPGDNEPPSRGTGRSENAPFKTVRPQRSIAPASLKPRPNSIFTLRPMAHTEKPPPSVEDRDATVRRRAAWIALFVALGGGAIALTVWVLHPGKRSEPTPSMVFLNGAPATKETPSGAIERWAGNAELTIAIDSSIDQLGDGARESVFEAFGTWIESGASLPKVRFDSTQGVQPSLRPDGKNVVMYAPIEIPGHKNDVAVTIGFADDKTGRLLEAD